MSSPQLPSLLNATILQLSDALERNLVSSAELVRTYLARIAEVNDYYHAVIELNPEAFDIANLLDSEQKARGRRGALHGIPILLKDNMCTLDSMETTAGSCLLIGAKPSQEARLVQKLRIAGAVFLGKTNMSEWDGFRSPNDVSGWSPRRGMTKGAYCDNMHAGGGSSGAAVASALGLAAAAIGSETNGNIVSPAQRNAVVGFKPTAGLISNEGMIPLIKEQDCPGPITRTVQDAAILLDALREKPDSNYPQTYLSFCDDNASSLEGLRIGLPSSNLYPDNVVLPAFSSAVKIMKDAGATIIKSADFSNLDKYNGLSKEAKLEFTATSFAQDIKEYLSSLSTNPNNVRDIDDLLSATRHHPNEDYPKKGIEHFNLAQEIAHRPRRDSADETGSVVTLQQNQSPGDISDVLYKHNLDLLAAPAMLGPTATFAAQDGLPLVVVPLGYYPPEQQASYYSSGPSKTVDYGPGVPFGVTFIGPANSEGVLLKVASVFEQLTKARDLKRPFLVPKAELSDPSGHDGFLAKAWRLFFGG